MIGSRMTTPRFAQLPAPAVRSIRRTSTWLGLAVIGLGLAALIASVVLPGAVMHQRESLRVWVTLAGNVAAAGALGAGGGVLSARACVSSGHLNLWYVRSARAGLLGTCVLSTLSAAVAVGVLARIATKPADWFTPAMEFGARGWSYVGVLVFAVALTYTCFVVLRPLLWRSPYAI